MLKKILQYKLKILARLVIAKQCPEIIGVTGSAGKTSAAEAIYAVLSVSRKVRRNEKNYNNEIGLPLTILGESSPGRNVFSWLSLSLRGLRLAFVKDKNFPEIIILEMGVDRPGDMEYLNSIVSPRVGVITLIGPMHLEYFGSIENITKEKGRLITELKPGGWAVMNYDDEEVRKIKDLSKVKVITYGFDEKADLRAQSMSFSFRSNATVDNLAGMSFKMSYSGSAVPVRLPRVIGQQAVYAALAGAAVGIIYGMNLVEIGRALAGLKSPKGRMNLIPGVKGTVIIDDTYNSSPKPTLAALEAVSKIPVNKEARKFAVLGDMLELGSYSVAGHQEVGQAVVEAGIDYLIAVGERSLASLHAAREAGMSDDRMFHFSNSDEAKKFVQEKIRHGDLILVKGSQGMRMERVVKEIMAEPQRVKELLVRQDWEDA